MKSNIGFICCYINARQTLTAVRHVKYECDLHYITDNFVKYNPGGEINDPVFRKHPACFILF